MTDKSPDQMAPDSQSFITLLAGENNGESGPVQVITQDTLPPTTKVLDPQTAAVRQEAAERDLDEEGDPASAFVPMVGPDDVLSFRRGGVQPYVMRKLRLGEYTEASYCDLHGCTLEEAYARLRHFLDYCLHEEYRCVLIVHGKGTHSQHGSLLKSHVAYRLKQVDEVLAYHSAPAYKGGTGALLVILRKGAKSRSENRERFSRRGRHT